jgi:hypothetical protein
MTRTNFTASILVSISLLSLFSCTSNEIGNIKDVNPDAVFFDYTVFADEDNSDVTVNLQYRMGGKNGTSLVLDEPSKVLFDGEQLKVDSAKVTGAFYEMQKPLAAFTGKHVISFTDLNKKEYNEEFEFTPFTLEPNIPAVLERGDLVFTFSGLESVDVLSVTLTDTSFQSADIMNDTDTVRNGRLVIAAHRLSALVNGPINFQLYKEVDRPIKNGTKEGGNLHIRYGLKRQFELQDAKKL